MSIDFRCPQCDKAYQAPDHLAGKTIRCRSCDTLVSLPGAPPQAAAPRQHPPISSPPAAPSVMKLGTSPAARRSSQSVQSQRAQPPLISGAMPMQAPSTFEVPAAAPLEMAPSRQVAISGGGNELVMQFFEGFLGLALLVAGGGMYWAYSSFTEGRTLARRSELFPGRSSSAPDASSQSSEEASRQFEKRIAEIRAELEARKLREQRDGN